MTQHKLRKLVSEKIISEKLDSEGIKYFQKFSNNFRRNSFRNSGAFSEILENLTKIG
jgi:hypothetical protein